MTWLKRHDLAVFLFLAFALAWWPWPFHLLNPNSAPMIPWGPIIAAFIVLGLTRGWPGIKSLLADTFRLRVAARWYALAFLLPSAIVVAAAYLNAALGAPSPDPAIYADLPLLIPAFLITTVVAGPLTEEPAWRGFLLPRLQAKYSPVVASLIVAGLWWSWHLPLIISDATGQRPPLQFLVTIVAYSLVFTWVYQRAKASVFIITLMHGVNNTVAAFLFRGLFGEYYGRLWWIFAGLWGLAALWALLRLKAPASANAPDPTPSSAAQRAQV